MKYAKKHIDIAKGIPPKPEDPNGKMLTLEEAIEDNRKRQGVHPEMEENIRLMYAGLTETEKQYRNSIEL